MDTPCTKDIQKTQLGKTIVCPIKEMENEWNYVTRDHPESCLQQSSKGGLN